MTASRARLDFAKSCGLRSTRGRGGQLAVFPVFCLRSPVPNPETERLEAETMSPAESLLLVNSTALFQPFRRSSQLGNSIASLAIAKDTWNKVSLKINHCATTLQKKMVISARVKRNSMLS